MFSLKADASILPILPSILPSSEGNDNLETKTHSATLETCWTHLQADLIYLQAQEIYNLHLV